MKKNLVREKISLREIQNNVISLAYFIIFIFSLFIIRLWILQVIQYNYYAKQSVENFQRILAIEPVRGRIISSKGKIIADTVPTYNLVFAPGDVSRNKKNSSLLRLARILELPQDKLLKPKAQTPFYYSLAGERLIQNNLSPKLRAKIESQKVFLPGVHIRTSSQRIYPYHNFACHLIGYTSEISRRQLALPQYKEYHQGDIIGQSGLEKSFETLLRGTRGEKLVVVTAKGLLRGGKDGEKIIKPARPGKDIILTLDWDLQQVVEEVMDASSEYNSAVVAIKPFTGEILALCSRPSFDPNVFSNSISRSEWLKIINDQRKPLQNRAITGLYPPGSVYKIILSTLALQEGFITDSEKISCPGKFMIGNHTFRCWLKRGHGSINITEAIKHSCDVFFYKLGMRIGIDAQAQFAINCGWGQKTGIALPGEKEGIMPSRGWKLGWRGNSWLPGDTVNTSIGQGFMLTTPIQVAVTLSAIINGGTLYVPSLIKAVRDYKGGLNTYSPKIVKQLDFNPEVIALVKKGMWMVVNDWGTGYKARLKEVAVCGKTGTSQNPHGKPHAWFFCYFPCDNPEILLVILVENAGHGGDVAAPMAKNIIQKYREKIGLHNAE